ncbi:probetacellulin [Takifugu flavidus]|uniref:Probetacellulin Betacellulin n=2 Tax=Takifugu TaxID=31032 RepID=A0A5C6NGW8_9TELE|nr:probetacellulin [Takifugu flavidus]XP_056875175.1 probetacellulin [Takifugu flavidus]TNM92310.1 hypothetical protein fugu_019322 [Takifugu bimaculatus]TWW66443.1 Probetacellulin Betacellulin [Takifugu flavidus]
MAKVYLIYVQVATALALFKYSLAEWNVTEELANRTVSHCHHHSNGNNCTGDSVDNDTWHGHFSKCPEELTGYCVHGDCRYIEEQKAPSCRCERGFVGSRCEYLELDWWRGEKQQILIICIVAGLVLLILLILFICLCSNRRCRTRWQRRRRREVPTNVTEKLSMMDTAGTRPALSSDPTEPRRIDTV